MSRLGSLRFIRQRFPMSTLAVLVGLFSFAISCPASSIAKQSTLTIEVSNGTLSLDLLPSAGGSFGKSSDATIAVSTDNFTGYTLSIASSSSTSLVNGEDEIESISTAISENTFTNGSTYNNKWGYKPSQYVTTSGGINTTVSNTNFLPAPSLGGDLLAVTSTANSTDDEYTLSFGAKVDASLPAGTYSYTYVLTAVANTIVYNITYDDSTSETVTDMPSPNPVALEIDGGTPTVDSYVTLSSNVPIMTSGNPIMSFSGWCSIPTTYNSVTENYDCSGTTYAAGADYPVDQTSSATNITLYAIWLSDPFPKVWSQTGKCIFNSGTISGSECQNYVNDHFIDTGIALYSNDNYQKDYEVHFTLDAFNPGGQSESQATIFNDKLSSSVTGSPYGGKSPGIVVRITSNKTVEIKSTYGAPTTHDGSKLITKTPYATAYNGTDVRIFRIDGIIYTSIDNGPLEQIHDFTPFSQQFGLSAWFGAYPDNVNCTENCTAAKRYITGEMSNMYIKLGDMPTDRLHTITYDANGGTPATTTYLILDGDALSEFPTVTRSGWSFDGWWTASSTGQQISTATVPTATTTYYAHWYKSVTDAQITNTNIALSIGDTETINITNAADIEPYTLVSSNPTVATVNSAGVITAVSNGAATITLTGSKTGDTRTISVAVGTLIYVDFDSQGGSPSTYREPVANGGSFSSLPEPVKTGYELEGWYTGTNGAGNKLTTSTVFDTNTPTQYYAYWTQGNYVCKAATVQHEETCNRTSGGCRAAGYAQNARILYGSMIQPGATSLVAGNALTCDIDNNQTFDETNERFYYLTTVGSNAALLYYKNISNDENYYDDALALLPDSSTTGWTNPNLVTYDSLLMNGDYEGKNARFMSYDETVATCNNSTSGFGTDGKCLYILEQSNFAYTNIRDGYWIGKANHSTRVHTSSRNITDNSQRNGVRPVIEVPLDMIDITVQPATYTITFNPHNESSSWDETIDAGDDLSDVYPATDPTYTNHIFQGWYTDASVGTQITSSTVPSGSTTYHAQWKGTVALATVASNSISMTTNDTATVTVTNTADLEGFTFSSSDTSVATIDASTGVITPLTAGTTNISIMGTTSNTTNQIVTVTVTAPVPTTYTVYFNPHNGSAVSSVTVNIGSPIGSNNIPSDPTPSGVDEVFMGWFTAASGGTAVDGITTPSVDGETYHAQYKKIVCKLETSSANLHVHDTNVAYGQIANSTTPQAGDAYNCDVDYDDTYSAVNERFYYVGQDENDNAVLVAWNSYYNGAWAAGTGSDSIFDYTNALGQLPANTSGAWDNPGLIEQDTGKAARFTTRAEVAHACGDINVITKGSLVACDYFMEHSAYDSGGRSALWLMIDSGTLYRIHSGSGNLHVTSAQSTATSMVRPTIVVPYKLIEKYVAPAVNYSVTFDPQNGDSSSTITVTSGNSIAADMPQDPTYTNHVFVRWYDISNNNTVTSATQPSSTMIVYAEWKLDVTQATISNADLTLAAGDQLTLLVGNSSQLESYTFSSANTATATVDASTGVITGVAAGIVNIIMTGTQSNLTKTIEVQVTAAQVVKRNVTFNANGGTTPSPAASFQVDDGTAVGSLPTTSRTNYRFFGWYKDDETFYNEVTPATTVDADATYYARWVEDTSNFPIVFSEINECEFNGNAVISGTYCTQDKTKKFIDSGIALFSTTNYQKDFEIGFTITDLTLPQPVSQGTLVNSKYENSGMNYPGFVFRSVSGSGSNFELTARFSNGNPTTFTTAGSTLKRVKIVRENQIIKYSINDGTLTTWYDVSGNTHRFDTNVWFGAAAQSNGTSPQRYLTGKLTDMYVKLKPLSTPTEYLINFNPGSGSFTDPTDSSRTVTVNNPLGSLPIPNPPSNNHTFVGWFDESTSPATQVTASTVPDSNKTYVAHYSYQSSNTPVTFNVSNNATRGYQNLIDGWVQSPINITTFNEASPINNSTWGVTSELSELQFWEGIRSNFVNNNCLIPSYGDAVKPLNALSAWTNGSVDCSKPDAYDTNVDAPLTVYLYDLTNSTLGTQVDYAKASEGVIHNMIPGQTYYWEKSDDSTVYGYVTATSNKGTRWVDTGTIRNVRDLGGLPVAYTDGNNQSVTGTLKYGRLFRGEKLGTAAATELTNLGITTEYNVGDEYSSDTHLSDYHYNQVIHYDFDYNTGDENNSSSNYMKAWTAVTNIMTDIANTNTTKNVYFHCRVGADRTGTVAYLLEGLLGVPDEMRYEEYALTNVSGLYDRTRYYKQKSSSNNLKFVYMMGFVETTQDIYNWYMHNPNADVNLIQAFRTAMVDRN